MSVPRECYSEGILPLFIRLTHKKDALGSYEAWGDCKFSARNWLLAQHTEARHLDASFATNTATHTGPINHEECPTHTRSLAHSQNPGRRTAQEKANRLRPRMTPVQDTTSRGLVSGHRHTHTTHPDTGQQPHSQRTRTGCQSALFPFLPHPRAARDRDRDRGGGGKRLERGPVTSARVKLPFHPSTHPSFLPSRPASLRRVSPHGDLLLQPAVRRATVPPTRARTHRPQTSSANHPYRQSPEHTWTALQS